ncbi:hypothetical protein KOM00_03305 [Geomonas sp. Red69]|uniref:hypothetical protein n=1 Tax=Geomonas diazotrophica TaxID=2843197 RepID=UPI001C125A28|nr:MULTISPECIES: hypothetical protein [Geomonas]MBU5635755.1 hypothetical protein [Geomonas diazotrophica]QXE87140.1 hypothetical protein KP003_01675 [Geomonas nitrogeniifigens]
MKRSLVAILIIVGTLLAAAAASASTIRAYIAEFTVSPTDNGNLKNTLQRLLATRLAGDGIVTVDTPAEADVIVSGSYTTLGKMFSLDAIAKSTGGKQLSTAFEQGESMDALIPAVGKISGKLKGDLAKQFQATAPALPAAPVEVPSKAPRAEIERPAAAQEMVKAPSSEIVHNEATPGWISQRLSGVYSGVATWGTKEFVAADDKGIHLYRPGAKLDLVTEVILPDRMKILALDAMGPEASGRVLVFVTIMDRENISSRIYALQNDVFKLVAEDVPYMFRTIAPYGGSKKLYAQQMGRTDDFYGDVYEASIVDKGVKLSNPIKMPRFANIFNFNQFRDQSGKSYLTTFSDSGYLLVYSDTGEELWRSSDKFGGSETYFQRRDWENERTNMTPFRTRFLDQRITVTEKGEILVPQNSGFFVLGNLRSYSKYSVVNFVWNGSSLEEKWRTKQSQNYLADYSYNPASKELILLEVAQKGTFGGKGGSVVRLLGIE